jgi:hypothetical protein
LSNDADTGDQQPAASGGDGQSKSARHPKARIALRILRILWRRRRWRNIGGQHGPNCAEASIVILTLGILFVGYLQYSIYRKQARLMQYSLNQTERSVILNMGQVAIANRNAKTAEDALTNTQLQFRTEERPWIMAYGAIPPGLPQAGIVVEPSGDVEIGFRVEGKNIGKTPAVDVDIMPYELRITPTRTMKKDLDSFVPTYKPGPPGADIPPSQGENGFVFVNKNVRNIITRNDFEKVKTGDLTAYFIGAMRYRDLFKPEIEPYETIFCVQYNPIGIPVGTCGAGKFGIK